jgi:hypothetical protein
MYPIKKLRINAYIEKNRSWFGLISLHWDWRREWRPIHWVDSDGEAPWLRRTARRLSSTATTRQRGTLALWTTRQRGASNRWRWWQIGAPLRVLGAGRARRWSWQWDRAEGDGATEERKDVGRATPTWAELWSSYCGKSTCRDTYFWCISVDKKRFNWLCKSDDPHPHKVILSERCSCLWTMCIVHFVEIIWNFQGMVMKPKYVVVWIYEIFWSSFAITISIYWNTKE